MFYYIMRRDYIGTVIFETYDSFNDACFWLITYRYFDENASYWIRKGVL